MSGRSARVPVLIAGICLSAALLVLSGSALARTHRFRPGSALVPLMKGIRAQEALGDSKPVFGSDRAEIKYVVFTDFQCPACAPEWEILTQFAAATPNVAIYIRELPLEGMHPRARKGAVAAEMARSRGKFADVAKRLYKSDLTDEAIAASLAAEGISEADQHNLSGAAEKAVEKDMAQADSWRLHSTPTVLLVEPDGNVYRVAISTQISRVEP